MKLYLDISFPLPLESNSYTYIYECTPTTIPLIGCRVEAPIKSRSEIGYIVGINNEQPAHLQNVNLKAIKKVIDEIPLLPESLIKLAFWISEFYFCSVGQAFDLMLPHKVKLKVIPKVVLGENYTDAEFSETIEGRYIIKRREIKLSALQKKYNLSKGVIREWINKSYIRLEYELSKTAKIKHENLYFVIPDKILDLDKFSEHEKKVIECLFRHNKALSVRQIVQETGVTENIIKKLCDENIIESKSEEVFQEVKSLFTEDYCEIPYEKLSSEQKEALQRLKEIKQNINNQQKIALIHGVTCSGKTEVYIKWVSEELANNKSVIVLVPEIALTPQMLHRFKKRFGKEVAILHSKLTENERFEQWEQIRRGLKKVVIGVRSAVFAPVKNLGSIIIDEESEATFKQSEAHPRYHAKEVAIKRAEIENALVILGSATPSLESYHLAKANEITLIELKSRVNKQPLPKVEIVDMRHELVVKHNRSMFSEKLTKAIKQTLENKQQVILFINRRGFANFVFCRTCGFAMECKNCKISLVYHANYKVLRCHYCGYAINLPNVCPKCNKNTIKLFGSGTQRIESETKKLFPDARIARLDSDSTTNKEKLEEILNNFGLHKIDILIGTQMVAKGLDFPNVGLVGILAADSILKLPDFRSAERTFSLIAQVSGRSGRGNVVGRVVLQTYAPHHHSIKYAINENYSQFYNEEIINRAESCFPPIWNLILIEFQGSDLLKVQSSANLFYDKLVYSAEHSNKSSVSDLIYANFSKENILGPAPAPISVINNQHRYQILLRGKNRNFLISVLKNVLKDYQPLSQVKMIIDVDPYFTM